MVQTQRFRGFTTDGGFTFPHVEVAYQTWGALNAARDNAVVVCHALTGSSDAAAWWSGLVGPGQTVDPARHFVVCANVLGSCYGTTGPASVDPATGARWGGRFPAVTVGDMARLHGRLLDRLGVRGVALAAGGSMGGMQALALALNEAARPGGGRVRRLALVGMGAAHGPWQIGISHAQRLAIAADPRWRGGHYPADDPPTAGLAAARAFAMMTYRSPALFEQRFGRDRDADGFAVSSYLRYQGDALVARFDAASYVRLTEAMDAFDAATRPDGDAVPGDPLAALAAPALCVGIASDVLYPPALSGDLAARLGGGVYARLESDFGHDGFLVDFDGLRALVDPFLHATGFFETAPSALLAS